MLFQFTGTMIAAVATTSGTNREVKLSAEVKQFCPPFSMKQIHLATQNFSEQNLIGKGGSCNVYKGQIYNGQKVAVKRLNPDSRLGKDQFLTEIETLGRLRHDNLVSLIGHCIEDGEMILVCEYIAGGTLASHLHKRSHDGGRPPLTWKQRLIICIGTARCLEYLHTGTSTIHRDVKSENILLNENFRAKVSDFGLAKHLSRSNSQSHVTTRAMGTPGYWDPSYIVTGRLTKQSDTFSFGVVLLEVLSGRPALDHSLDKINLAIWALEKISKGKADQIVASELREQISSDCLKKFLRIAKGCLNDDPEKRPMMAQVVVDLQAVLEQHDKKEPTPRFLPLNALWDIVKHTGNHATGSTEQDYGQFDVNMLSQDNTLNGGKTVDTHLIASFAIPLSELKNMTDNFSSKSLIVLGNNRNIYRGALKTGKLVAIKKLVCCNLPEDVFLAKVSIASQLKHKNVAQLLGYCVEGGQQFLAYEYAQNGSLQDFLNGQGALGSKQVPALSWAERVKIAVEAAKGLEYIHQKAKTHCNVKSSNVLLFDDYKVAKLADFFLSTQSESNTISYLGEHNEAIFVQPRGYYSLKHNQHSKLWQMDVYSFGVVLLELLTGRKLVDHTLPREQQHLVKWATPRLTEDRVKEIVDVRLNEVYPLKAVAKMASIAASCVQHEAEFRPDMSMVVDDLKCYL